MFDILRAGGIVMVPIILCSIVALAIIVERIWTLQEKRVSPRFLVPQIRQWAKNNQLNSERINALGQHSALGRILVAGLARRHENRAAVKEGIEEMGRQVSHELQRYLTTLGTIAGITPLLGLLGTVLGMIKVFNAISVQGVGNPGILAGGISEALITTATGLSIAIPCLIAHRFFHGKVDELVVSMEREALKFLELIEQVAENGASESATESQEPPQPE